MKIFQILGGICHWDATRDFSRIEDTYGKFDEDILFVEAPDNVFEGWGYDDSKEGDERFIQPTPPEGWLYDEGTGTFYPEESIAPSKRPTADDDRDSMLVDLDLRLTLLELGVTEDAI